MEEKSDVPKGVMALLVQAQEPIKQKIDMRIESVGYAMLEVSMTMNANQWQMWVQSVGNNPALLKRRLECTMPGYFLDDFNLEKNDMERSFELSCMAYDVCQVARMAAGSSPATRRMRTLPNSSTTGT